MSSLLDSNLCRQLGKFVETLTHTGQKTLDKDILKKLKKICKISDGYVEHTYHLVIYQLQKGHAEIRFSAFQICDELFRRSHCFRELLVSNLQHVMELTCETSDNPLPPPRSVALNLKRLALQTIQEWNKEFGDGYKKLQLGYNFLRHCKKVDFNAIQLENTAEQARRRELDRRLSIINEDKLKRVNAEINELQPEITSTITALENCIALLLPTPEDFFIEENLGNKDDIHIKPQLESTVGNVNIKNDKEITEQKGSEQGESKPQIKEPDIKLQNNSMATTDHSKTSKEKDEEESVEVDHSGSGSEASESEEEALNFREHGIINSKYSIEVNVNTGIPAVKETTENAAVFENAKDMHTLINNRYLPVVKKWIQTLTKIPGNTDILKKIIDLKQQLEKAAKRYIQLKENSIPCSGSESSDSDFEEVKEKDGYESTVQPVIMPASAPVGNKGKGKPRDQSNWSIWSEENNEKDPTSAQSTLKILKSTKSSTFIPQKENEANAKTEDIKKEEKIMEIEPVPSTSKENPVLSTTKDRTLSSEDSRKAKLLAVAPKVPFDIDLYHWEDEKVEVPTMVAVRAEGSRFWYSTQEELEEVPVPDGVKSIRTRVIEFTGKFEPVQWSCRAPLPNGKLCPRRDRYKCPFHGRIVGRDKMGQCTNPEDKEKLEKEQEEKNRECPDWQDPQLLEDIKKSTGMDLKIPEKNKGKGKKKKDKDKYPGLTDIKAKQNTAYNRLSKKIFKRGAVKRIARTLDAMDHKRFRDKYGDQFHYMYDTA